MKHKLKIKGKEKSKTEFYYEIELETNFEYDETFNSKLDSKILFDKTDKINPALLKSSLPAITTVDKLHLNNLNSKPMVKK